MTRIVDIKAREIMDSRGNPTVEADVFDQAGLDRRMIELDGTDT